jgi:hypothetical protein
MKESTVRVWINQHKIGTYRSRFGKVFIPLSEVARAQHGKVRTLLCLKGSLEWNKIHGVKPIKAPYIGEGI